MISDTETFTSIATTITTITTMAIITIIITAIIIIIIITTIMEVGFDATKDIVEDIQLMGEQFHSVERFHL